MELKISIGAMSPNISEQLKSQNIEIGDDICVILQKDVDAINRLRIRGLITNSESRKADQRFMKQLVKEIEK